MVYHTVWIDLLSSDGRLTSHIIESTGPNGHGWCLFQKNLAGFFLHGGIEGLRETFAPCTISSSSATSTITVQGNHQRTFEICNEIALNGWLFYTLIMPEGWGILCSPQVLEPQAEDINGPETIQIDSARMGIQMSLGSNNGLIKFHCTIEAQKNIPFDNLRNVQPQIRGQEEMQGVADFVTTVPMMKKEFAAIVKTSERGVNKVLHGCNIEAQKIHHKAYSFLIPPTPKNSAWIALLHKNGKLTTD